MRDPTIDLDIKKRIEITSWYLSDLAVMLADGDQIKTGKRGRPPQRRNRHVQIADAVAMLVVGGLNPTRSHVERRRRTPSACSIVTAALAQLGEHLDERTVEGIWNQHRRWALDLAQAFCRIIRDR
jgi:hypothetical protein